LVAARRPEQLEDVWGLGPKSVMKFESKSFFFIQTRQNFQNFYGLMSFLKNLRCSFFVSRI
jgi:hypothetical protein